MMDKQIFWYGTYTEFSEAGASENMHYEDRNKRGMDLLLRYTFSKAFGSSYYIVVLRVVIPFTGLPNISFIWAMIMSVYCLVSGNLNGVSLLEERVFDIPRARFFCVSQSWEYRLFIHIVLYTNAISQKLLSPSTSLSHKKALDTIQTIHHSQTQTPNPNHKFILRRIQFM
jgi:hypothetical protein